MSTNDNYLADLGYSGLALPRRNVPPLTLMLMERDRAWTRIGGLGKVVLAGDVELPEIEGPEPSVEIGGEVTRTVEIGLALKVLSSFLSVFGGGAGIQAKYSGATEADIAFEDVTMKYVDLTDLDTYLGAGRVNDHARNVMLWLNDGKCIVISNVLQSPKITMTARRDRSTSFEVNLPEIEQVVNADVKVSGSSERTSTISFQAKDRTQEGVIFGIQALQLNYSGNVFHTWRTVAAQNRLREVQTSDEERDVILEEADRMKVQDEVIEEIEDRDLEDVPRPPDER